MGWFDSKKKEEESVYSVPVALPSSLPQMQQEIPTMVADNRVVALPTITKEVNVSSSKKTNEPFFVRVDKFNEAKDNLQAIEKKMRDMERVLEKIYENKKREDEELDSWKEDVKSIREYLAKVDEDVFNRL